MRLDFEFKVGENELHSVRFSFDQIWGWLKISVDGTTVLTDLRLISFGRFKDYRFVVGERERHQVLIRKERQWIGAGFRGQVCHVFIDGKAVGDYVSQ